MKSNKLFISIAALGSLVFLANCGGGASSQSNSNAAAAATPVNVAAPSTVSKIAPSTPTEASRQMFDAMKAKDIPKLKSLFSAGSLEKFAEAGKQTGKSVDEVIKQITDSIPLGDTFAARDEKIEGETATVEMNDKNGKWTKNRFVKEDGSWKISIR